MQLLSFIYHSFNQFTLEQENVANKLAMLGLLLRQIIVSYVTDTLEAVWRRDVRIIVVEDIACGEVLVCYWNCSLNKLYISFGDELLNLLKGRANFEDDVFMCVA
jgi:hypothetical protein